MGRVKLRESAVKSERYEQRGSVMVDIKYRVTTCTTLQTSLHQYVLDYNYTASM